MYIVCIIHTCIQRQREDEQNIRLFLILQKEILAIYYIFINIHNFCMYNRYSVNISVCVDRQLKPLLLI